jgi:UDP-N-acetylmuramate dehydrogenase
MSDQPPRAPPEAENAGATAQRAIPHALGRLATYLRGLHLEFQTDLPISRKGFWRIGGPADLYLELSDPALLAPIQRAAQEEGQPLFILGNGSNLLVADQGIRGLVIRLIGQFRESQVENVEGQPNLTVGAGTLNVALLRRLELLNLGGLGALAGVPGTIGGAIRMNAGTALGEVGARVVWVDALDAHANVQRLGPKDLDFSYRHAHIPAGWIILRAGLALQSEGVSEEKARIAHHLERRAATQPLDLPSCGSVFKNPPGTHAGRLIEEAGLKGMRHGGAQISEKHANFIINTGKASAADVLALIQLARRTVAQETGILLEPEVHLAGDWEPDVKRGFHAHILE